MKNILSFDQTMYLAKTVNDGFGVATTVPHETSYSGDFYLATFDSKGDQLWNHTYSDGVRMTSLTSLISTRDGGFLLVGNAYYHDQSSYSSSRNDIVVLRTDSTGNLLWNRTYGGADDDYARTAVQTVDDGFAITAFSRSFKDSQSVWLIKTDPTGTVQWNALFPYSDLDLLSSSVSPRGCIATKDSGFLLFGVSSSYESGSYQDFGILFKTDSDGNVQWTQTYPEAINYAFQTQESGYVLATDGPGGTTILIQTNGIGNAQWNATYPAWTERSGSALIQTRDGGLIFTGKSSNKLWLIKTAPLQNTPPVQLPPPKHLRAANASLLWQQFFDGLGGSALVQTSDGGYAFVGKTGILQNDPLGPQYVNYSSVLIKTDAAGKAVFRKDLPIGNTISQDYSSFQTIIRSVDVVMTFVVQTSDGGYALAGTTTLHRNSGTYSNYCMAKTDSQGNIQWVKQYDFRDSLSAFAQASDGGYILAGSAGSFPGSVVHVVKVGTEGEVQWNRDLPANSVAQIIPSADGGYTVLASAYAYASGSFYGSSSIAHLNSAGVVDWTNSFTGFSPKTGVQTIDGGYVLAGISDPHSYLSATVLMKVDSQGNMSWYKLYDSQPFYYPKSLIPSSEGGFLFAATTPDFRCIVKVDKIGNVEKVLTLDSLWTRYSDNTMNVIQTSDGEYVFVGQYIGLNTTEYDRIWLSKTSLQSIIPFPTAATFSPGATNIPPLIPETEIIIVVAVVLGIVLVITLILIRKLRVPSKSTDSSSIQTT